MCVALWMGWRKISFHVRPPSNRFSLQGVCVSVCLSVCACVCAPGGLIPFRAFQSSVWETGKIVPTGQDVKKTCVKKVRVDVKKIRVNVKKIRVNVKKIRVNVKKIRADVKKIRARKIFFRRGPTEVRASM